MSMRWSDCSLIVVALLAASASAEASPRGPAATTAPAPAPTPLVLNIRLMSADKLPLLSRIEFVREVTAIWRSENIRLNWLSSSDPGSADTLGMLVAPTSAGRPSAGENCLVVGELLKLHNQRALAVVSINAAKRVLAEGRRSQFLDTSADYERRLGVALGRAAAHEIGHYVLHTSSHAASGLMRANFVADELADAATDTFSLDDAGRAHLHLAATAGVAHWIDQSREDAFSYSSSPPGFATLEVITATADR